MKTKMKMRMVDERWGMQVQMQMQMQMQMQIAWNKVAREKQATEGRRPGRVALNGMGIGL
jgi:hypothetical protein